MRGFDNIDRTPDIRLSDLDRIKKPRLNAFQGRCMNNYFDIFKSAPQPISISHATDEHTETLIRV